MEGRKEGERKEWKKMVKRKRGRKEGINEKGIKKRMTY